MILERILKHKKSNIENHLKNRKLVYKYEYYFKIKSTYIFTGLFVQ